MANRPTGWKGESQRHSRAARTGWAKRKVRIARRGEFTAHEIQILSILRSAGVALNISDIARYGNMAPETVKQYLAILRGKGRVEPIQSGERVYWRLR